MCIRLCVLLCAGLLINCMADDQWTYETFTNRLQTAEEGDVLAQAFVGFVYQNGAPDKGIEKDYKKAVKWLGKAAEAGSSYGQFGLALCYHSGHGVEQDYEEALKWYVRAAEQGHTDGLYYAGLFNYLGYGCETNEAAAIKYLEQAAITDDADSLTLLGLIYFERGGYPDDFERAKKYLKKAIELGDDDAKQHLAEVEAYAALIQSVIDEQYAMIEGVNKLLEELQTNEQSQAEPDS